MARRIPEPDERVAERHGGGTFKPLLRFQSAARLSIMSIERNVVSRMPDIEPKRPEARSADAVKTLIAPHAWAVDGFEVRRALPAPKRRPAGRAGH